MLPKLEQRSQKSMMDGNNSFYLYLQNSGDNGLGESAKNWFIGRTMSNILGQFTVRDPVKNP